MPAPAQPLTFPPACLTPLHDQDLRALQALTAGWSPPDPVHGTVASTLGPAAYRRLRLRRGALVVGYVLVMMTVVPLLIVALTALADDPAWHSGRVLTVLYWFLAGGAVLTLPAAAIGWHTTGGRRRIAAGAEPASQLTFTATPDELVVTNAAGWRRAGPWRRWRLSHLRSQVVRMRYGRMHHVESVDLVHYADDGTPDGRVALDPITLENGHAVAATIIAMICRAVNDRRPACPPRLTRGASAANLSRSASGTDPSRPPAWP